MTVDPPRHVPARCRVFRLHDWVTRTTEDGSRYRVCAACGRERSATAYSGGLGPPL
jgi:hypothetical protein